MILFFQKGEAPREALNWGEMELHEVKMAKNFFGVLLVISLVLVKVKLIEGWTGISITIKADGSIVPSDAPIRRDGNVYILTDSIITSERGITIKKGDIILDGNYHTIHGVGSDVGIFVDEVDNVTIKNMVISHFSTGVSIYMSDYNIIANNEFYQNDFTAIEIDRSEYSTIMQNDIKDNQYGIYLLRGDRNVILNNTIQNNQGVGIYLTEYSDENQIINNYIGGNEGTGILILESDSNIIKNNRIDSNTGSGIKISSGFSINNLIFDNNITQNGIGICIFDSSDNIFYHNNIIGNDVQVELHDAGENIWDNSYPSGGNYWSDYSGTDSNGDGIGDTPYIIDEKNKDRYPFIKVIPEFSSTTIMILTLTLVTPIIYFTRKKPT